MSKKRILILSDPSSAHTIKWVNGLSNHYDIFLFGFSDNPNLEQYKENIQVENFQISGDIKSKSDGALRKLIYLKSLSRIKKIIKEFKPNILHSHYATSYGLLGALTSFKPYIISVWGSDINNFPNNKLTAFVLKSILNKANLICATSNDLAIKTRNFFAKEIKVIPFGIDTDLFQPVEKKENYIGIVKSLEPNYGVEYLLKAYAKLKKSRADLNYKLLIVGDGSQYLHLKNMAEELKIEKDTEFTGFVSYNEIHKYHQKIKIGVFPSFKESFGVAIAELMSCGGVVIASNVDGIKEIVQDEINGLLIEPANIDQIVVCLEKYLDNPELVKKFILSGRKTIEEKYSLNLSICKMIEIYQKFLA